MCQMFSFILDGENLSHETLDLVKACFFDRFEFFGRSDFELLLDFNREIAYKVLWSCVRLLSGRLRSTNDSLRSFLAMSMF